MNPYKSYRQMRRHARGFTLLELLLALGLVAMLMLGITQLMTQAVTLWGESEQDIMSLESDKMGIDFVRKILLTATPLQWYDADLEAPESTFSGDAGHLYLVGTLPIANAEHLGMYLFDFSVKKVAYLQNSALVISYRPLQEESKADTLATESVSEVVLTDVRQVHFEYYGYANPENQPESDEDEPSWQSDWQARYTLPFAVRMRLTRIQPDKESDLPARIDWGTLTFGILQRDMAVVQGRRR